MLEVKNLNKSFGSTKVLNNINLKLEKGKILGLLGPNGSGKTTLIKIILNLCSHNSGEIKVNDEKLCKETNRYISYLPDVNFLDKDLSIEKVIDNHMFFYDDFNLEKANNLLNKLKLNKKSKIKTLSKGMVEKLLLILVLSRDAKIYILDEPIAGVDIVTRKQILNLILENISSESSAIITTHLIKDIEQIFDEIILINEGVVSQIYDVEDIRSNDGLSAEEVYLKNFGGELND